MAFSKWIRRTSALTLVAGVVVVTAVGGATTATADTETDAAVARSAVSSLGAPALGPATGTYVYNVTQGEKVVARGGIRPLIPASTMKVITAYAAVRSLGNDYRFTTKVVMGRSPDSLVLVGGGDPVLSRGDLSVLAKRTQSWLKKSGASQTVRVDFDDDLFAAPTNAPGWESGDMPAFVSAVRPLTLLGLYSTDTSRATAQAFVGALQQRGVTAIMGDRVRAKYRAARVARFRANDVTEALGALLPTSENNVAEMLFRQVAKREKKPATWAGAADAVTSILMADGIRTKGIRIIDGSGLSYANRLSARTMTEILTLIATRSDMSPLRGMLPIAGQSGTLRNRFGQDPARCAQGKVTAKTGSLPLTVSTLAGLARGDDGQQRAFAVLVNERPSGFAWSATSAAIDAVAAAVQGCNR